MILVTGFEAFGRHTSNPTARLAESLGRDPGVVSAVLPVAWDGSLDAFARAVERHRPRAAIAFGLDGDADTIRVERIAVNLDEAAIPDNTGLVRQGTEIVPGGPAGLWSGLPVGAVVAALRAEGIPAGSGVHAGTYVCNHLFYGVRHRFPDLPMGFVHVPPEPDAVSGIQGRAGMPFEELLRAARTIVAVVRDAGAV